MNKHTNDSRLLTWLMAALVTAVAGSTQHRALAVEDSLLRSYADAAKLQIELQPSPLYESCAQPTYYSDNISLSTAPYTVQISSIEYWNSDTSRFATACPGGGAGGDGGLQEIMITAQLPGGADQQQLSFVVRNPSYAPS